MASKYRFLTTPPRKKKQTGLTIVELMVAMAISMLIALAAVAALVVARQGFNTVDSASQLRDNLRFSAELIQRLATQTGFKDVQFAANNASAAEVAANIRSSVTGFNNALLNTGIDPLNNPVTTRTTGVEGYGSDILILAYQAAAVSSGSSVADGSVIDCAGNAITVAPASRDARAISIIHVAMSQDEPTLMCTFSTNGLAPFSTQPIIQGVENFQVLYGTDGVTPNAPPTLAQDSVPDRFLRADQLEVTGDAVATQNNWRRVRSLKIGFVVRGPPNSQLE